MPWIEKHEDKAFMDYIRVFPQRQKPKIMNMLAMHPDIKVYHFKDREEALVFLNKLN